MDTKKHYKLYKSGKLWVSAAITTIAIAAGIGITSPAVSADTVNNEVAVTRSATPQAVNNKIQAQPTVNNDQNANQGNLDHVDLQENQQTGQVSLNASGWHATGKSDQEQYRYVIVYDNNNNREVSRQAITVQERPDVQKAYPQIDNSDQSGFNVNFNLPQNVVTDSLSIVSRYSDDPVNGEGHHTDFWFGPLVIDNGNHAVIDNLESRDGKEVHVSGWHATNQAAGKKYHYIIAYDQTRNREITRQRVVNGQERRDVASAYPSVANAGFPALM